MPPRTTSHLVGRADETRRLRDALGWGAGGGGAVLLGGDAGIGKTALVGELAGQPPPDGVVLVGHCIDERGGALPYLPFVEVLAALDDRDRDLVDTLAGDLPGLVALVPRLAAGASGDTERHGLVEAVHGLLVALGRRQEHLVVVEDVHWADESTRDLLTLLLTRGAPPGVSFLVTYRTDDVHRRHPLGASLATWSRLPALTRLDLGPLGGAEVRDIVRRVDDGLDDVSVDEVVRRAEGNAFFAEELAAAASAGAADRQDLTRVLLSRVDQLDEDAQAVVRVAAVLGRRVPHDLLECVAEVEGATLRRALRAAIEHHVLEPWGDVGYQFRHALLAEAVLEDLLPTERLHLHRASAAALRDKPGLGTSADLARHALASGDLPAALAASVAAGDAARRMGGPAEALQHYETAIGLVHLDPAAAGDIVLSAATAAVGAGRTARASALLRARLAEEGVAPAERAALLAALAYCVRLTEERTDRAALTAEALGLLGPDADPSLRAEVLTRRAEALLDTGDLSGALPVAEEAMDLAVEHGLAGPRAELTAELARLSEVAGDTVDSIRRLEAVIAQAGDTPDLALLRAQHMMAAVHYRRGDFDAAVDGYRKASVEARRAGLEWSVFGVDARAMAATAAYEAGRWDLALELTDHRGEPAPPAAVAALDATASYVHAARGTGDLEQALGTTRPWWSHDGLIAIQAASAALDDHGWRGRVEQMLALRDELVTFLRTLWDQPSLPVEVRVAAVTVGHLGTAVRSAAGAARHDLVRAGDAVADDAARVWAPGSTVTPPNVEGRAWSARLRAERGRLHWLAGDDVDAAELVAAWREAVALFAERGEPYEVARSRARLAEVLHALGDPDAVTVADDARRTARALGAAPLLAELDRRATPTTRGHLLTAREAEVLALLAQGRSNGEVGRALFISTKTASVHVSNILAKLGAASRGEAVARAREAGLLD